MKTIQRFEKGEKSVRYAMNGVRIGLAGLLGLSGFSAYRAYQEMKAFQRVEIIADLNNDGITTLDEWRKVYDELGVTFDEARPQKLARSQLEQYLSHHERSR
ncbi:hypothetical protein HZB03_03065 [Candidatus Woesearchaeota archaeon]|nr:hypothetical protein [Candidatus Woesearchaeota archaeon]